ncbi:MAG: FecR domain-containing protein [Flavobacteriales bacterium]
MNGTPHITSEQIAAYVAGEADAALRTDIERWAAAHPANAKELQDLLRAWEWSLNASALPEVDVEAAWQKVQARIAGKAADGRVLRLRPMRRSAPWLAAAAVVGGLFFAMRILFAPGTQAWSTADAVTHTVLKDSSRAVLSPYSEMTASIGNERSITLKGQAYFEVARDTTKPFTVRSGDVLVTVLGTGFEVSAYDTSGSIQVKVRHGHVRVETNDSELELLAGDAASYDRATHRLSRVALPSSVVWGDRILQFEEASMTEVVQRLESIYDVRIDLGNPAIGTCRLTADFDNESIDRILGVIADTFGITVQKNSADHYQLDGDGC